VNEEKDLLEELAKDADDNFSLDDLAAQPVAIEISLEELVGIPPQD
jgi:hypothetical protein